MSSDFASAIDTLSARGGQEDEDLRRAIAASLADNAPSGGDNDEYIETGGADSDDTDAGPVNIISETRLSAAATTLDNNFPLGSGLSLRGQDPPATIDATRGTRVRLPSGIDSTFSVASYSPDAGTMDLGNVGNTTDLDRESQRVSRSDWWRWNETWRWDDVPGGLQKLITGLTVVLAGFIIIGIPCILSSSSQVPFDKNALLISQSGTIESETTPGRRWHGIAGKTVDFPRFDATVEYSGDDPIEPRVKDGQTIKIDLSFQYAVPVASLTEIYRMHKEGYEKTLRQLVRGEMRNEASRYESREFFHNRTHIANEMRKRMVEETKSSLIDITGFQIRNVVFPKDLTDNLINVQIQRQDARARQEQLELDRINADADAHGLKLKTEREKFIAEYEQQTVVQEAQLAQKKSRVEETTRQILTRVNENKERNVSLYTQQTDIEEEAIKLKTSIEVEITRRDVDKIRIKSETDLAVFHQETENMRLQYENNVTIIKEQTLQAVTKIKSATTEKVSEFKAKVRRALAKAKSEARVLVAEIRENSANDMIKARKIALAGLPASVYVAETIANGTMSRVKFLDTKIDDLVGISTGANGIINLNSTITSTFGGDSITDAPPTTTTAAATTTIAPVTTAAPTSGNGTVTTPGR